MKKLLPVLLLAAALPAGAQFCYTVSSIAYAPDPFNGGTNLGLYVDDEFSGLVNLPFTFCFDGVNYNQCLISTNGYICFNLSQANGYSDWEILGPIPTNSPSTITNSILGPWQDLDITVGGEIYYATYGVSPNRRFVVSYNNVTHFQCNAKHTTAQITLYETSNNIDIIQSSKQRCPNTNTWNNNWATEGVQNAAGTIAFIAPGRNASVWTTTSDAYRFTNTCSSCATLPVSLSSFTGELKSNVNHIAWTCASETNNDYFTLERSSDGVTFQTVARIDGHGTTSGQTSYSFDDRSFPSTWNYYRLTQTDFNGVTHDHGLIAVDDRMYIEQKKILKVINATGQEINLADPGFKIIIYEDGSVKKQFDLEEPPGNNQ